MCRARSRLQGVSVAALVSLLALSALVADGAAAKPAPELRIIGGSPTEIAEWPWQVSLQDDGKPICGGSLVAPTVVVTAAHCVFNPRSGSPRPAARYEVITGRTRLSSDEGQKLGVARIHSFTDARGRELYKPQRMRWDVVLLELARPSSSTPIRLAGPDERDLWSAGRGAWVSGWGSTKKRGGGYPDGLRTTDVRIVDDGACDLSFGIFLSRLMVCAGDGSIPQHDTCDGDSGGPLVVPIAAGGWRLVGATSFGDSPCGGGGVYTRLAADPIRGAVRSAVLGIAGIDVVGSGGTPPPFPPPRGLSQLGADQAAERYARRACRRNRTCRDYFAGRCRVRGGSFRCKAFNLDRIDGRRLTFIRRLRISERPSGAARVRPLGRWGSRRGWVLG